ncbi:AAA family ATPase [Campylobacter lari]|uniref:shikimate kinase n=1 Tax=Campylobacter sp. CNRCH_2007_0968H TaxID=2911598 RepID=UPI001285A2F2|nr:shikimate kinase [Campylobacter sp. CNRCH_2007_0968H]EAJ5677742.1 AAA family ATPase [Campylobacter lari]EAK0444583.1 AAA family ATPase [Campylobacter lari]EAK9882729.1 AAA family ATPase [Campylobacter lari]EAK9943285.1 AAA family ATPase [Campylobacter lari]EGK8092452.1 AAA family ATPase [Campylobacter lari]
MSKKTNLLFVGFMGCGKTTIARAYAKKYDKFFLDTDVLIKEKFNLEISEFFKTYGEKKFRKEEKKLVSFLTYVQNCSIASGGGFIEQKKLKNIGTIVYLKASFDYLLQRLNKEELITRPLFSNTNNAKILFDQRIKKYEKKANIIINIENKNIQEIIKEIKKEVK